MPRPLQKQTRNGVAYVRRPDVEAEISELENLEVDQLLERCQLSLGSKAGSVSPEALLYFVRTIDADNPHLGQLANILIGFIKRQLPNPYSYDGESTDLYKEMISDLVIDPFVLRLFCDRSEYQEQLDFYEVNFYRAIAKDRMDAYSKAYESRNRSVELLNEDQEISSEVEKAVGNDNPFDPEDLRKEDYREWFRRAISTLPPKQMKIMELLLEEVPITSNDPGVRTISKELGKAEKTIRNQRDQALDTLRRRFVRKESQQ